MATKFGRRANPTIPPAVEASPHVVAAIRRWLTARDGMLAKAEIYDDLRDRGGDAAANAWSSYQDAVRWEARRWGELWDAVPIQSRESYAVEGVTVFYSPADRSGLSLRAAMAGEIIRK